MNSRLSSWWRHALCYVEVELCVSFGNASSTRLFGEARTLLLKGTIVSFFSNVCFNLLEVTVMLPSLVGLVEGPVLSYRGDSVVLTGVALVCVRLVVRVKSGTFYVDKRHDSASVTPIMLTNR